MMTVVRSTMRIPCRGPAGFMRSVSRGAAVEARLGPALQRSRRRVDDDALVAAGAALGPDGLVAASLQLREDLLRNSRFHGEHATPFAFWPARGRGRAEVLDARRLARRLHVHAQVE